MCGICGYISLKDKISDKNISFVKSMAAAIRHRGPDHTGYWNNDKVALGNPRLSVIDLSENGNLPMNKMIN